MATDVSSNPNDKPTRTLGFASANTNNNTAYVAGQTGYLVNIRVANVSGSDANVTLAWYNSEDATEYKLIFQQVVPKNGYTNFPFERFRMKAADEIRVKASAGNAFNTTITVVELAGRSV